MNKKLYEALRKKIDEIIADDVGYYKDVKGVFTKIARSIASAMPENSPKSNELAHYVRGWNARGDQFVKSLEKK